MVICCGIHDEMGPNGRRNYPESDQYGKKAIAFSPRFRIITP
jgi:hypothetical protein